MIEGAVVVTVTVNGQVVVPFDVGVMGVGVHAARDGAPLQLSVTPPGNGLTEVTVTCRL